MSQGCNDKRITWLPDPKPSSEVRHPVLAALKANISGGFYKKEKRKQKYCPRICGKDTENCSEITNHNSIDGLPEGNVNMSR